MVRCPNCKKGLAETDIEKGICPYFCIYFPFFAAIWQATPGKMAMKIKVVDTNLKKASFLIIVLRETFGKLLASFCFGHLWLFFNKDRKEMWDYLARTLVVEK